MTREELKVLKRAKARVTNGQIARFEFQGTKYTISKYFDTRGFMIRSDDIRDSITYSETAEPDDVASAIGEFIAEEVLAQ